MYKLNGNRIIIERTVGSIAHIRYRKNQRHIYIYINKKKLHVQLTIQKHTACTVDQTSKEIALCRRVGRQKQLIAHIGYTKIQRYDYRGV